MAYGYCYAPGPFTIATAHYAYLVRRSVLATIVAPTLPCSSKTGK